MTNLEHFRAERGLSKAELARRLGLSRALVAQVCLGFRKPYPKLIRAAADVLEVPFSALEADLKRGEDGSDG